MRYRRYTEPIIYTALSGGIAFGVCWKFYSYFLEWDIDKKLDFAKVVISLFGTLLGFLLTLLAIVISLTTNNLIQRMVQSGHYDNLILSSKILAMLYFITLIVCTIGLFTYPQYPISFVISIFFTVVATAFSIRTAFKFFQILKFI